MSKNTSEVVKLRQSPKRHLLVARLYFDTNRSDLGLTEFRVLNRLVTYCSVSLFGNKIQLAFRGNADKRSTEAHNLTLSGDRAQAVKGYVDGRLKPCSRYSSVKIPLGEARAGSDYAEDRRVDIFMTEDRAGRPIPPPKKFVWSKPVVTVSSYPYQFQCDNPDLFRPLIFRRYHPDYSALWSKLYHLIERDEKLETLNRTEEVWIRPGDEEAIAKLIEKYFTEAELHLVERELSERPPSGEFAEDFAIIYRGQYPVAYALMEEDFSRSPYRHQCEFLAHKFGLVPHDTPYARK